MRGIGDESCAVRAHQFEIFLLPVSLPARSRFCSRFQISLHLTLSLSPLIALLRRSKLNVINDMYNFLLASTGTFSQYLTKGPSIYIESGVITTNDYSQTSIKQTEAFSHLSKPARMNIRIKA